ncbi:MAG: PASTA domain-containing protein, partial [Eubacterium sp.]
GVNVTEGTKITLYVSRGRDVVSVPGLVGLSEADARARINSNGLTVGTVTTAESDYYNEGMVISQSPTEGTDTDRGATVNFVVSSGKPKPTPTPTPPPTATPPTTENPGGGSGGPTDPGKQ